ncbi:MAG TPA: hypothetical protein VFN74_06605 [Chloroflexota bacterium]|nr:hypothetical protein [Chloroflexota bacterium]
MRRVHPGGRTIERNRDELRPLAEHPLFDFQQHTYNHVLLKTVCIEDPQEGMRLFRGGTLEQIREEVSRTTAPLRKAVELGMERCTYADYYRRAVGAKAPAG